MAGYSCAGGQCTYNNGSKSTQQRPCHSSKMASREQGAESMKVSTTPEWESEK
eukprot:CAMPEP_0172439244 /NCGR_PEP_ID=MMETSP1065-20121228/296_1 /TAXON_ID=265537 /ORGANISM="Amphiprora paludosa, Strain CCMP125" /LENGTH=52 /DNA_ID=CAMNT_0013187897 /DNA_START=96 /DNA_END=254 /DNA_ORIENTATION=+